MVANPPTPDPPPRPWVIQTALGLGRPRLDEGLLVEALELLERGREDLLRGALVGDDLLEILVLELAVLPGALELDLHFRDLLLQVLDLLRQRLDERGQLRDLAVKLLDVARLDWGLELSSPVEVRVRKKTLLSRKNSVCNFARSMFS